MKKFLSFVSLTGLVVAALAASPASGVKAQAGLVSSILNRLERQQRSLKTLSADISMDKYNSQLRESEKYYGHVRYIPVAGRAAFIRLEWNQPQHEILVVANGAYTLYRQRLNVAWVGTTNSIRSKKDSDLLVLMNMSAAQLRTRFGDPQDVREDTLWGGVWTQHLTLVPKGAASYRYIEVWIDKEGMPVQTKMVEKNDDATTVRLTNLEKNQTIPMDEFKLNLDASVKRVKG